MRLDLWGLLPALASVIACGSSTGVIDSGDPVVSSLRVVVTTDVRDAATNYLVVGEAGTADILVEAQVPCVLVVCSADVDVWFGSSDASVLSPGRTMVRSDHGRVTRTIVARAPGTADVTAVAQGFSDTKRVTVLESPLLLDTITIRWMGLVTDDSIPIAVDTDAAGNLVALTLPRRGSAWLTISALSGGRAIFLPVTFTSSDSSVVWASPFCRAPVVDPTCGVASPAVTGLEFGTARVTVTARNRHFSFAVTVRSR